MDQVLTQQEIDSLLNAMSTGELDQELLQEEQQDTPKIKRYDFRRPTKLSKEYVNTLHMIFDDFSKLGSGILSTQLRTNATMQLAAIEQVSYDEFIHSIPKFTLISLFHAQPLNGVQMLEVNPQLCMWIIELLCGGLDLRATHKNKEFNLSDKKNFTDMELALLEGLTQDFISAFKTVWKDIVELKPELDGLDTNPQMLQNMSPNEPVILVTFTVKIFDYSTFINLCIPYVFFEGIIDKLSFRNWFDSDKQIDQNDSRDLQRSLNSVELDVNVTLGDAQMTLADFLHLEPGDVVKLNRKITDPLTSYIEGKEFYHVKPGHKGKQLAIELLEKMEGDQNE